ncbi:MAG: prepilin-type N-terminal cleavage/methylation domain-containing protein [Ruminococcaceae bacterium]|nr:prepilin-type N-terminal cleavage/methylation domain-containing protein [Oscillospiraceae bacterium]
MQRNRKGFTTVELVIVIAVIAILATVLIPTFSGLIGKANDSKALQEAKNAHTNYLIENGGTAPEYILYEADGRFVALHNGTPKGVYATDKEALKSMIANADPTKLVKYGKMHIYGAASPGEPPFSFAGKKVSIMGDSISTFGGVPNVLNAVYPHDTTVKSRSDTWWQQVIDTMGMELLVNNASGGSRILSDEYFQGNGIRNGNYAAYRDRCVNLHSGEEKPDVILVFMGTNDFSYHINSDCTNCQVMLNCAECTSRTDKNLNVCETCRNVSGVNSSFCNKPLGTADSVDLSNAENPTSTCEAYAVALDKMKQAYPDVKIYCLSLLPRVEPYQGGYHDHGQPTAFNAELKKVAEKVGATFVDLEHCVDNASTTWKTYFGDAVHPTATGMDFISQAVIDAMLGKDAYHAVAWNLSGVNADVKPTLISDGTSINARLYAASGCQISSVAVTMDGVDITDSVYVDGKITIPAVTGNITITSTAKVDTEGGIVWSVMALNSSDGKDSNNGWTTRVSTNYIEITNGVSISATGGAEYYVFYFNKDLTKCDFVDWSVNDLNVPSGKYVYMRIVARNKSNINATLTPEYGNNIQVTVATSGEQNVFWSVGAINSTTGADATMSNRIRTGFINVSDGVKITVTGNAKLCPIYYNENFSFHSCPVTSPDGYLTELNLHAGEYAYMRLMVRDSSNNNLTADYGQSINVMFQ